MLQLYLPVAEMSVNMLVILAMGAATGFLSGMFGIGGGFLLTPLLMFSGVPSAVAVATGANQIVATSMFSALAQWRRGNVDTRMGAVLIIGGLIGAFIGVQAMRLIRQAGQADLVISLSYVAFLGTVGTLMLTESARAMRRARAGRPVTIRRPGHHNWMHGLPFKMRFHRSKLYISAIPPVLIGVVVGLLASVMGIGGGFVIVPAMIYLLRMPTSVVIGTSMFQILFVSAIVTVMHAVTNQTLDIVLALLLMIGGVIGGQFGSQAGQRLRGEQLRLLLALLVLAVCARLLVDLILAPADPFNMTIGIAAA